MYKLCAADKVQSVLNARSRVTLQRSVQMTATLKVKSVHIRALALAQLVGPARLLCVNHLHVCLADSKECVGVYMSSDRIELKGMSLQVHK